MSYSQTLLSLARLSIIHPSATIGSQCAISLSSIGSRVTTGENVKIYQSQIFGSASIGKYTSVSGPSTAILATAGDIKIGNYCSIGPGVIITTGTHDHAQPSTSFQIQKPGLRHLEGLTGISIEDDVWIGANATIVGTVTVGRGAVIGAGSVVVADIPPYAIAVGNPSKVKKKRFNEQQIELLESLKWWELSRSEATTKLRSTFTSTHEN